jgi:hypothetical protein
MELFALGGDPESAGPATAWPSPAEVALPYAGSCKRWWSCAGSRVPRRGSLRVQAGGGTQPLRTYRRSPVS